MFFDVAVPSSCRMFCSNDKDIYLFIFVYPNALVLADKRILNARLI